MGTVYRDEEERWRGLALQAQLGDKNSYTLLLKEVALFCRNYLSTRLSNLDWADDVTQEVLISIHKSLATYSADRPFRPWLMAIISFRKADYLRKYYAKKDDRMVELNDSHQAFVTNPAHTGELKDIEAHLAKLPSKQRKIFEKMRIHGYTAEEVAQEMGMSISAVKVSVHRSQKKLDSGRGD